MYDNERVNHMTVIRRKIVLGLGFVFAFGACSEGPTALDKVPDSVVENGVRFQAAASEGDDPREVTVQVDLLNTQSSARDVVWGGCGIEIRLYRSGSLVYDSRIVDPCEDIGHSAVAHPGQIRTLTESIVIGSLLNSGHYDVVMLFRGEIDNVDVQLEVRAGAVEL
jgi:hypothetical protein